MQDRGLAAYIAELVGTFFLVFVVGTVVTLYVAVGGAAAQFGSDFAVIGLVHAFVLFFLVTSFGSVSGGHFNPAVTIGAAAMRKIDAVDGVVYILAQLSGGVLGALLVKGLLLDEGRAGNYGAVDVSPLLAGDFAGAVVEALGTFMLVLAVIATAMSANRAPRQMGPAGDRLDAGLLRDGLRAADRRLVQPGPLVRPGADRRRVRRRLALHRRPARRRPARGAFYRFVISPGEIEEEKLEPAPRVTSSAPHRTSR